MPNVLKYPLFHRRRRRLGDYSWPREIRALEFSHEREKRGNNAKENDEISGTIYLGIDADDFVAFLAAVGEDALVALDAVGMLVAQDITLARERLVALPTAEVTAVPILVHCLGVLATENQLQKFGELVQLYLGIYLRFFR